MGRVRGFTLVEAMVVIAMVAILAGLTAPRFIDFTATRANAASRRLAGDIRFAQRLALATHKRCGVAVGLVAGTTYTVFTVAPPNVRTPAIDPLTREPYNVTLDVALGPSGAIVEFDERGRPLEPVGGPFTLPGRTVTVEPETGAALR